jgi:hypothetical protein
MVAGSNPVPRSSFCSSRKRFCSGRLLRRAPFEKFVTAGLKDRQQQKIAARRYQQTEHKQQEPLLSPGIPGSRSLLSEN